MYPKLWEIPGLGLPIYSYGFMVMMGFLAGIFVAARRSKQDGISSEVVLDLGIVSMIAGVVGARIAFLLAFSPQLSEQFAQQFKASPWAIFNIFDGGLNTLGIIIGWFIPFGLFYFRRKKPQAAEDKRPSRIRTFAFLFLISIVSAMLVGRIGYLLLHRGDYTWIVFQVWKGGLVFYGGLILAVGSVIFYVKMKRLNLLKIGDLLAPSIALGLAFGRVGCLLNGCCWGKVSRGLSWAVQFPRGGFVFQHHLEKGLTTESAPLSLPVHPTEIYHSLFGLALFVILSFIWSWHIKSRKKRYSMVFWLFVLFYSIGRFIIEFYRGDNEIVLLGLTISQNISIVAFFIGLVFLYLTLRKKPEIATS